MGQYFLHHWDLGCCNSEIMFSTKSNEFCLLKNKQKVCSHSARVRVQATIEKFMCHRFPYIRTILQNNGCLMEPLVFPSSLERQNNFRILFGKISTIQEWVNKNLFFKFPAFQFEKQQCSHQQQSPSWLLSNFDSHRDPTNSWNLTKMEKSKLWMLIKYYFLPSLKPKISLIKATGTLHHHYFWEKKITQTKDMIAQYYVDSAPSISVKIVVREFRCVLIAHSWHHLRLKVREIGFECHLGKRKLSSRWKPRLIPILPQLKQLVSPNESVPK